MTQNGPFAWICACTAASQRGWATRAKARRNAGRHFREGCTANAEAFNVVDLSDDDQRDMWQHLRREQLTRTARGAIARYVRDLFPASPDARSMGCPCPQGVGRVKHDLSVEVEFRVVKTCPVHGAWVRDVAGAGS